MGDPPSTLKRLSHPGNYSPAWHVSRFRGHSSRTEMSGRFLWEFACQDLALRTPPLNDRKHGFKTTFFQQDGARFTGCPWLRIATPEDMKREVEHEAIMQKMSPD